MCKQWQYLIVCKQISFNSFKNKYTYKQFGYKLLYSHNDKNNNNNKQIQAVRMSLFLSTFSPRRHEKSNTKYKSLCWPYYADPHLTHILWYLRTQLTLLVETQIDLLSWIPKNQSTHFKRRTSTNCLYKILKFSGTSLPGTTSTIHSVHAITMTSWFGVTCVWYELVAQL